MKKLKKRSSYKAWQKYLVDLYNSYIDHKNHPTVHIEPYVNMVAKNRSYRIVVCPSGSKFARRCRASTLELMKPYLCTKADRIGMYYCNEELYNKFLETEISKNE